MKSSSQNTFSVSAANTLRFPSQDGIRLIYDPVPVNTDERETLLDQLSGFHLFAEKVSWGRPGRQISSARPAIVPESPNARTRRLNNLERLNVGSVISVCALQACSLKLRIQVGLLNASLQKLSVVYVLGFRLKWPVTC